MNRTWRGSRSSAAWGFVAALAAFLLAGLSAAGCGGDDNPQTVTIPVAPASLDFGASNDLYFVESLSNSVWKLSFSEQGTQWTGQIAPGGQAGFLPWGLATDAGRQHNVLFVTDTTQGAQRLVAVHGSFGFELISDPGVILASIDGPTPADAFRSLRAVAAYETGPGIVRVFVADKDRIVGFDFAAEAEPLSFTLKTIIASPGPGPCPDPFMEAHGLAVDPDNHFLYVVDRETGTLYRFSDAGSDAPSCREETDTSSVFGRKLYHPQAVTVLAGRQQGRNLVIVADSGNDRIAVLEWDGTALAAPSPPFEPSYDSLDNPFDLALDKDKNLWVSYPGLNSLDKPEWWPPAGGS